MKKFSEIKIMAHNVWILWKVENVKNIIYFYGVSDIQNSSKAGLVLLIWLWRIKKVEKSNFCPFTLIELAYISITFKIKSEKEKLNLIK